MRASFWEETPLEVENASWRERENHKVRRDVRGKVKGQNNELTGSKARVGHQTHSPHFHRWLLVSENIKYER